MKTFFTSDLHFGHDNVINFDNRPFASGDEMYEEIKKRWNAKVTDDDTVYILGDMFFKGSANADTIPAMLQGLNGTKILIKGNHDKFLRSGRKKNAFAEVKDYEEKQIVLENGMVQKVAMSHYFIPFYNHHRSGVILLHGHSHKTSEAYEEEYMLYNEIKRTGFNLQIYNVGCMYWDYAPVTLDEILARGDMYPLTHIDKFGDYIFPKELS